MTEPRAGALGCQHWRAGGPRTSVLLLGQHQRAGLGSAVFRVGREGTRYLPTISQSLYTGMLGLALLS